MSYELIPGLVFLYWGPRSFPSLKRGYFVGKVLGVDDMLDVVHVRTYLPSLNDEPPEIDISHLPISRKSFLESFKEGVGVAKIEGEDLKEILRWKKKFQSNLAGFYTEPIYKVEKMAWNTVFEKDDTLNNETHYIATTYPSINEKGKYTLLSVEVSERRQESMGSE